MTSPKARRQGFTLDERPLEIGVVFDDAEWTTWVFEDGHRIAAVASIEHATVEEGLARGSDVIGELIEASVADVLAGVVELPPRKS
ncbi:MAG: hypothetical protein IKE60_16525 [Reyranella sp.]|jgi:hypothetical protein|uniref:hypothetical protein n=1 Tax=Reyranella sp. TaxID=1929291 RepID=UPI00095CA75B|nr:hypothetical protein [Reyranella sp.]MBN9538239.1 hypothetical protein [Alphaproteobacteria bacterium]MBR2816260.1 hypothetical protein [Reyranella sp.]OJU47240.1 MAG: hypothetical protein BGN99_00310 [Alphaproteobacteria bacterium 65-37]